MLSFPQVPPDLGINIIYESLHLLSSGWDVWLLLIHLLRPIVEIANNNPRISSMELLWIFFIKNCLWNSSQKCDFKSTEMNIKTIKSDIEIERPVSEVFTHVFKMDLLIFFKNLPCIPLYTYNSITSEDVRPGFEHFIYFISGDTARRRLMTYLPETSFSVVIDQFSMMYYPGLREIEYQYCFCKSLSKENPTQISCEYQFKFRSRITAFLFTINALKCIQEHTDSYLFEISRAFHRPFWRSVNF